MSDLILRSPCDLSGGVEHPDCSYLAHIVCNKCGWIQKPHDCGSEVVLDPDTVIRRINDGWGHDYDLTISHVISCLTGHWEEAWFPPDPSAGHCHHTPMTIQIGHITTTQVRVHQDPQGLFHFQAYTPGQPHQRHTPMLCGQPAEHLREAAWFTIGDRRGRVHYDRACPTCRSRLSV